MTLEHRPAVAEVKSNGKNVLALRSNDYVGQTDRTEGKNFYARPNQFQSVSRRRTISMVPRQSNGTKSAYTRQPRIAYSLRPRVPQVAVHCTRAERLIDVCGVRGLSRSEPGSHSVQLGSGKQAFCMASALRPATRLSLAKSLALAHDNPLPLFFPMHLLFFLSSVFFARRQQPTRPADSAQR